MNDFDAYDMDGNGLTDEDLRNRFDESLDSIYGEVKVAGITYQTSDALKRLDPIAYQVGLSAWLDSQVEDGDLSYDPPTNDEDE